MARPAARPIVAGAVPNNRNNVEPKIKWTSDTPIGNFGRTSKKNRVTKVAVITRRVNTAVLDWRIVLIAYLIVSPVALAAV